MIEGKFLRMLLQALGEKQDGPTPIAEDNSACIQIAENPGQHRGKTKYDQMRIDWDVILVVTRSASFFLFGLVRFRLYR